jgi:acetyltransferase-like isoleucine patch superfamily enzyme
MDVVGLIRKNERLKRLVWSALRLRIRPNPLHRLLLAERTFRRMLFYEVARVLYYQPLFEVQCAQVGEGVRLELTPDSKVPAIDNCTLVLGDRVRINARTTFQGARNAPSRPRIAIGDGTYVGGRVVLRAGLGITIGSNVLLASNVVLAGDPGHPLDPVARRTQAAPAEDLRQITIGDDVWIAEGATVVGGVTIGDGAVIGAHAVVTRDVPPHTVVAGNPAKPIRQLDPPLSAASGDTIRIFR